MVALETTSPAAAPVSQGAWGLAVFDDLTAISNVQLAPLLTPTAYTNSTTTYTSIVGWSLATTKSRAGSALVVFAAISGFVSAALVTTAWAFLVDGTAYAAGSFFWNGASNRKTVYLSARITGLTAGAKTIQIQGKRVDAVTLSHNADDRAHILCFEQP